MYRDGRCLVCAVRRMDEQHRQMRERSGPQYELARERGRIVSAAWQAAGRPVKVTPVTVGSTDDEGKGHGETRRYLAARLKRGERVEATPEQVAAWGAWIAARPGWPRNRPSPERETRQA